MTTEKEPTSSPNGLGILLLGGGKHGAKGTSQHEENAS